ncbi:type VI secretion system-associated protein VasI [Marinobacter mobilis]|uniref:Type VI secretion system protein VasI n=1 Tax=Marinobacter mobilis TaxID=488533 RepID=A0A1H3DRM4_9GAMM|nr:type VI secretion system-associated protein VasI [Marinobacter mobilis]SDX69075.1 type VI secretion system protein VasI [Marinobacter mobilis]
MVINLRLGLASLGLCLALQTVPVWAEDPNRLEAAQACTGEPQRLVRLACFDAVFNTPVSARQVATPEVPRSPRWREAFTQEQGRTPETGALYRDTGSVAGHLVTIAALGVAPPRPLLLAQCHNNITELAVMLPRPSDDERVALTLVAEGVNERQLWRVRDSGYAVSSGRGLPAIHTLKGLGRASQFRIESDAAAIDGLVFDLSGLSQALQPLRQDCGW